jgi:NTE family protein
VIGVRNQESDQADLSIAGEMKAPSVAKVLNTLLNAVMLDGVDLDLEKLGNINRFMSLMPEEQRAGFKKIDFSYVSPSTDIGRLAAQRSSRLPRIIRYLLRGLGNVDDASEIISYLLFEPGFLSQLIELGFSDGMQNRDQIVNFLKD